MRIARFNGGRIGVVRPDTDAGGGAVVHDVTGAVDVDPGEWPPVGMNRVIAGFAEHRTRIEEALADAETHPVTEVRFDTPIPWPCALVAIPVNYSDHAVEMSSPAVSRNAGFFVLGASSLAGHGGPVELPNVAGREVHHEAELAVVIGRRCRGVSAADALDHVFGYSCLMDVTVRGREERAFRKSHETFTPVGPWITTRDEVGDDLGSLHVVLDVDGEVRQDVTVDKMIMPVPDLIEMCSSVMTLEPGDIIATGTGAGVGPLHDQETATLRISRVGELSVAVTRGQLGNNSVYIRNG